MTLLLFDCFKEPIKISKITGIVLNACDILADFFDRFVEPFLAAAGDKDVLTFLTNNLAVAKGQPVQKSI